jgi:signal transduction histidine kinase/ActR/RegA family two-component response regulator
MKKLADYLPFAAVFLLPLLLYPGVNASGWHSSSDVHALLEFASSLLAVTAGVMVLLHFFTTGRSFFLTISVGFVLIGAEEFVHAIFGFDRMWAETPPNMKLAISTTWLTGQLVLAASFFAALLLRESKIVPAKRGICAVVYNGIGLVCMAVVASLIFHSPILPRFVQIGSATKIVIELSFAALYFTAFVVYSNIYFKQQSRSPLLWSIAACILFRVLVHLFIFDAHAFFDSHWDAAHLIVFLSYFFPIFGVWGETIKLHRFAQGHVIELAKEVADRRRVEDRMKKINACMLSLGTDFLTNVNRLTALCGELLGATCSLYNRLEGNMLCSLGRWNTPPDYTPQDRPDGHICYDVIRQGDEDLRVIRNLAATAYATSDANVTRYGLQTYIGNVVRCADETVGSLCVMFQRDMEPTDDDRWVLGIVAMSISIEEERKRAADALLRSNEKLERINLTLEQTAHQIKTLMDAVVETEDFTVRFDNRNLAPCWEVKQCGKTECPSYRNSANLRCWEVAGTFCRGTIQGKFAQKIGDCRQCKVYQGARANPVLDLAETFNNMIIALRDRHEELVAANRRLETATAQAQDLASRAQAANVAKSQFLANMSHEIRTPMNSILGFSELLGQESLPPEHAEFVRTIHASGTHLLALINDILDFSKIEAGKMQVEITDCSLPDLLDHLDALMRPIADKKGLHFEVLEQTALPSVIQTDPIRLRQCLTNLVNNAVKFTESGHVLIRVVWTQVGEKPFVRFDVEDSGPGIAPEARERIFEAFEQADGSTTRRYGGTGLGLTITRHLTHLLGGTLALVSEPGKGSVFTIEIPAPGVLEQPSSRSGNTPTPEKVSLPETRKFQGHVLIAEDVRTNQVLIRILLEQFGLQITLAEDGQAAVDQTMNKTFDLILMDMHMPRMTGFDAVRILRKRGIRTPIVALTASVIPSDQQTCRAAGCDDFLAKPIDRRELVRVLAQYLPAATTPSGTTTPKPTSTTSTIIDNKS